MTPNKKIIRKLSFLTSIVGIAFLLHSCANRGHGPQGGMKDTIPPKVITSLPANRALNVTPKEVVIDFDEFIQLDNAYQNVVFSPAHSPAPVTKVVGKKVTVNFADTLKPNTTYTIDFANSILDINEKNPLPNYSFAFSTGNTIDSLQISGYVLNAYTLSPYEGVLVGIYEDKSDSAFVSKPFDRMAKTNEKGFFTIKNVKAGEYKIFALNDIPQAYYYNQQGKDIAMYGKLIIPETQRVIRIDTLWKDTTKTNIDTIISRTYTKYLPNNVVLKTFKEAAPVIQKLKKANRPKRETFSLLFNAPVTQEPVIHPLNFSNGICVKREKTTKQDSLVYWISDPKIVAMDTLRFALDYLKSDAEKKLILKTDTVEILYRKKKNVVKKGEKVFLKFDNNIKSPFDIYDTVSFTFDEPVRCVLKEKISLQHKVDTTWQNIDFRLEYDQLNCIKKMNVIFDMQQKETYKITFDSACIQSDYYKTIDKFSRTFTVKSVEDYGNLYVKLKKIPEHSFVELLDAKEKVVYKRPIKGEEFSFENVLPGTYYLKMTLDENANGKWDTGNYKEHVQPEEVIFFNKKIVIRANWENEEEWDYLATPVLEQRPQELSVQKKNKISTK